MKSSPNPRRSAYVALLILTIILGLVLRRVPMGLPYVIVKYGGSMLWAMMIYWIVAALAALSARETYRIPMNQLGEPNAVPMNKAEYDRLRGQTVAADKVSRASA